MHIHEMESYIAQLDSFMSEAEILLQEYHSKSARLLDPNLNMSHDEQFCKLFRELNDRMKAARDQMIIQIDRWNAVAQEYVKQIGKKMGFNKRRGAALPLNPLRTPQQAAPRGAALPLDPMLVTAAAPATSPAPAPEPFVPTVVTLPSPPSTGSFFVQKLNSL